jgi:hypothetical protein
VGCVPVAATDPLCILYISGTTADVGDVTTLADPEIVEDIRHHVQSAKVAKDDVPRDLTEAEFEEIKKFGGE